MIRYCVPLFLPYFPLISLRLSGVLSTRCRRRAILSRCSKRLLSNLQIMSFATRDEQEVAGYAELMDLVFNSWQEIEKGQLHRLLIIALFVVVFLEIHPFQDGNGRLSRALTTLLLLQAGYAYVPYSSLESVVEHNKEAYNLAYINHAIQSVRGIVIA